MSHHTKWPTHYDAWPKCKLCGEGIAQRMVNKNEQKHYDKYGLIYCTSCVKYNILGYRDGPLQMMVYNEKRSGHIRFEEDGDDHSASYDNEESNDETNI